MYMLGIPSDKFTVSSCVSLTYWFKASLLWFMQHQVYTCIFAGRTPVTQCPDALSGFWQEAEAHHFDSSTKCYFYETLNFFEDPRRFEVRTMSYCADNGDKGTIDPIDPNISTNTTGKIHLPIRLCWKALNGIDRGQWLPCCWCDPFSSKSLFGMEWLGWRALSNYRKNDWVLKNVSIRSLWQWASTPKVWLSCGLVDSYRCFWNAFCFSSNLKNTKGLKNTQPHTILGPKGATITKKNVENTQPQKRNHCKDNVPFGQ